MSYAVVDALVDPQVVGADVRGEIAHGIRRLLERDGEVSAATLRPYLEDTRRVPPSLLVQVMPAMFGHLSRFGYVKWTGRYVPSANHRSRNEQKPVRVYVAADWDRLRAFIERYPQPSEEPWEVPA